MSVKPILFNTEMVRAILDGRKTVTRRVIKPQPVKKENLSIKEDRKGKYIWGWVDYGRTVAIKDIPYPYKPGDILYVRETWSDHYVPDDEGNAKLEYCYKADGIDLQAECLPGEVNRWWPSIHMPKDAARIWLKVTDVKLERLQDITIEQAMLEGISDDMAYSANCWKPTFYDPDSGGKPEYIKAFSYLWDSTVKKKDLKLYGWDANPWVWTIEFERIEKPEDIKK